MASIEQGYRLRIDAEKLEFPPNPEFGGKLILAREQAEPVEIGPGLTLTVVGPTPSELEHLRKKHNEWLKKLKKEGKSASAALAAYVDKSVPNLSSIVVLAQADNKRMLLTGDARGDKILEGLELAGLMAKGGKIHVDLLKVPHHGSSNNLDNDFFERITADHYVFSGDGEHGNPRRKSLEMLVTARGDADFTIHLTYPIDKIDVERKKDWQKEQGKEKKKGKTPRPNWSPKKDSLTTFFKQNPGVAEKVSIVEAEKAHVIDVGDPLGTAWPSLVE